MMTSILRTVSLIILSASSERASSMVILTAARYLACRISSNVKSLSGCSFVRYESARPPSKSFTFSSISALY